MSMNVLILSGPTHEYIDPVRFIGNASSGLMGKALAEEALEKNYIVNFVSGPVAVNSLPLLKERGAVYSVTSAAEMLQQAALLFPKADLIIFAAAVADYMPKEKHAEKLAKSTDDLTLHLCATPDIAKTISQLKRPDQLTLGFALQTNDGELNALRKLKEKNLDAIILNTPASLGASNGTFSFISSSDKHFDNWGSISKSNCAKRIFERIEILIPGK